MPRDVPRPVDFFFFFFFSELASTSPVPSAVPTSEGSSVARPGTWSAVLEAVSGAASTGPPITVGDG